MPKTDSLCVAIHDVAPSTWRQCERLVAALREVAAVPLTLLVVPAYHASGAHACNGTFAAALAAHAANGDELALHGYFHIDDAGTPKGVIEQFKRRVYTAGEGEFAALPEVEAAARIDAGLAWFAQYGWRPRGFVAPAWLMGQGAWTALAARPFAYATTLRRIHLLPERIEAASPVIAYSARSAARRAASLAHAAASSRLVAHAPMVRLALHPVDATHPQVMRSAQRALERLLHTRTATTKAAFAQALRRAAANDA